MTEFKNTDFRETWSQREQRLIEGRSSPTGWPIVRLDDGISIPPAPKLVDVETAKRRVRMFIENCAIQGSIQ